MMNNKHLFRVFFLAVVLGFPPLAFSSVLNASLNLNVESITNSSNRSSIILINLTNTSSIFNLCKIRIDVKTFDGTVGTQLIELIEPMQVVAVQMPVAILDKEIWITATFNVNNQTNSIVRVLETQQPTTISVSQLATLWSALVSFVGVIIGACLLHLFTLKREQIQYIRKQKESIFEMRKSLYNDFLINWNSSTSAHIFKTNYDKLIANCPIPPEINAQFRKTYNILNDAAADTSKKEEAVKLFYKNFESLFYI